MQQLSWEYIAGFFDGEGSVGIYQNRARRGFGSPVVALVQSGDRGKKLLTEISEFLSSRGVKSYLGRTRKVKVKDTHTTCHVLRVCNRPGVTLFLRGVFPYLRIKKIEAQDVLRFLSIFGSIKGWYFRELNQLRSAAKARGEGYVAIAVPYNSPDSLGREGRARVKYIRSHTPKWRHLADVG
jgi:intein/homing endonuclease